ncbi:class II glutamine amidotransferase [Candidatus Woesearchaeota archaeon]|nr:class II glutamine amidotransferase [Candidatus Woesearchaeota archaeon]
MCGIFGVTGVEQAVYEIFSGLIAEQHRGQDACGIHTSDGKFHVKKGFGLVADVIKEEHLRRLRGNSGVGHVRYATVGAGNADDIQPFYESEYFRVSMAHNGNLTNFADLRERFGNFASDCDIEAIIKTLHSHNVSEWTKRQILDEISGLEGAATFSGMQQAFDSFEIPVRMDVMSDVTIDTLMTSVLRVMQTCEGSFSAIGNIPGFGMIGFKDPHGIKPLVVGRKDVEGRTAFAFASEEVAFQMPLDYTLMKEVGPGSVFMALADGRVIERSLMPAKTHTPCIFEWIYFASPCSEMSGVSVSEYRYQLGKVNGNVYNEHGPNRSGNTICCHVPSAAKRGADGFSMVTGIPNRDVFVRNNYMRRGFILPDKASREYNAMLKMPIDFSVLKGVDTVIMIDDSIVRGDTSRNIVMRLRREAAKRGLPLKNVHFISLAPPNAHPCVYGIDMAVDTELVAAKLGGVDGVRQYIGVDYLQYQGLPVLGMVLGKLMGHENPGYCDACFSGHYPTGITREQIERIKHDRIADKGSDYA